MSSINRLLPPAAAGYPPMLSGSSSDSVATTSSSVSSSTSYTSSCSSCTSYSSSCTASSSRSPQQQQQQRYSSQKRANASESSTFSTCSCSSCSQCGSSCSGSSCSGRDSCGRCSRCAASCCSSSSWSSTSCDCSVCRQSNSSSDIVHHRPLQHHRSPLLAYDQSVLREQYDQLLYSAGLTGGMLKLKPPGTRATVRRSDAAEVPKEEDLRPREGVLLPPLSPPPPAVAAAPAGAGGAGGTTAKKHEEEEPMALTALLRQLTQLLDNKQQQQPQNENESSEGLARQHDEAQPTAMQTTMMMTMMQKMMHEASFSGAVSLLRSEETESRSSLREEERDAWSALVVPPLLASPSSHSTLLTTAPSWFTAFLATSSFPSPAVGSSTGAQSNEQLRREVETECDQLRAQLVEEEQEQRFLTWQQYHHETMEGSRLREQRELAQLRDALETERLQHVLELQQLTEAHHAQQEQQEQHLADRAAWHDNALATRFLHSLQALVEAETVQRVQFLEWLERDAFHALEVLHQESSNRLLNHAASMTLLRVQHEDALAQVEQRAQRHVEQLQARIEQLAAVAYEQQCRLRKLCQLEGQLVSVQSAMTQSRRGEEQSYQQQQQQQQPEVSANAGREAAPSSQQMMRSAQQIANNNNNNPGADEFGFVKRNVFATSPNAEGFQDLPVHERYHRAELAARRVVVQFGKVAAAGGARTQQ